MFTAMLGSELVDLRHMPAAERVKLHGDRSVPWRCRGCEGVAHMRRHSHRAGERILEIYEDRCGPFITFAHHPYYAEQCRKLGFNPDESTEHHHLKATLARSAEQSGWDAEIEVPGDQCIADVVVSKKGQNQRVLEAQLASLHLEEAMRRTERYERSFGRTMWTHTKNRPWSRQVESVRIDDQDHDRVIGGIFEDQAGEIPAAPAPLADVIPRVLSGELLYVNFQRRGVREGYFIPTGARTATRTPSRQRRSTRGEHVRECGDSYYTRTIPCAYCGHATEAGRPCPNDECAPSPLGA